MRIQPVQVRIFTAATSFGGGERYIEILRLELQKLGFDVLVHSKHDNDVAKRLGATPVVTPRDASAVDILNGLGSLYWQALRPNSRRRVYVHHTLLNDSQSGWVKRTLRKLAIRGMLRRVDACIRVCKAALPSHLATHVSTIYNAVPRDFEARFELNSPPKTSRILMIGAITRNKNQFLAIDLLSRLSTSITLQILGDGPDQARCKELAIRNGVDERIQWQGFIEDPKAQLRQARILFVPSIQEACPFVVIEAMAMGIPVIARATGGLPEIIQHGRDGFLFSSDVEAISLITKLMNDDDTWRSVSRAGKQTVNMRFRSDDMARQVAQLLTAS